ncbi:TPA: oligosaccharide flippase family protein [Raoultella planticola]|uniref:oligosaccharide flippase family protein n=1 Tax=Raoultella planticola TaxID=575 RepID=UPI001A1D3FC8|nr:oligosaccharide flippase family protein [Raoultella planticola]
MKGIAYNVSALIIEKVLVTFILMASNIVVIRYLGAESFGLLSLFQVYLALITVVTEFGVRRVYTAQKSVRRELIIFRETFYMKVFIAIVMIAAFLILVYFTDINKYYLFLVIIFIVSPWETYSYHFEANLRNDLLVKIRVSITLSLAIIRIALCLIKADISLLMLSFVLNYVITNLCCYIFAKKYKFKPLKLKGKIKRIKIKKYILSRSFFFWISVLAVQLNMRTDQILLSTIAGAASVGIYAGAYKLVEQLMGIPSILANVLLPHISRNVQGDKDKYLFDIYRISMLVSLPICATLFVLAPYILPALLGKEFLKSVGIFEVLISALPILVVVNISGLYYSIFKLEKYALFRNVFGLIVSIILNYIFIKSYGAIGAAISVFISYTLLAYVFEWVLPVTRKNAKLKFLALLSIFNIKTYQEIFAYVFQKIKKSRT